MRLTTFYSFAGMKAKERSRTVSLALALIIMGQLSLRGQESPNKKNTLFLDCDNCPEYFIRQEMEMIDFVRDRKVADIHLFISRIGSAGGGQQYELRFLDLRDDSAGNILIKTETSPK